MEQLYSIGTTNRYAMLIDDDEDPGDVIVTSGKEPTVTKSNKGDSSKETTKTSKVAKGKENKDKSQKQNKAVDNANKTSAPERVNSGSGQRKPGPRSNGRGEKQATGDRPDNRQERQSGGGGGGGDERRGPRGQGGRPRLASKDNDRENAYSGDDRPPRGGRGSRPYRGGGRGGQRTGKREFERRSGSDKSSVKAVDKREGGGAHNWGKQDEAAVEDWPEDPEAQQDAQEPVANGDVAPENKEKAEGEGEAEVTAEQEEDPSAKEMTLDEYKAQHNVETLKADMSLRRNVDNSQWKDTIALKKEDAEFFPGTREIIEKPKTSGRTKTTLDPNFYFKDQARRGRGRTSGPRGGGNFPREDRNDRSGETRRNFDESRREGGRGGNRRGGFGSRGGNQGRFNNYSRKDRAPNMEDESDFPTLGAA